MCLFKSFVCVFCVFLSACSHQALPSQHADASYQQALQRAQTYLLLGQWQGAKQQLNLVPKSFYNLNYWRLTSLYWLSVGSNEQAIESHREALTLYPDDAFLLNNYGTLLGAKGLWSQACAKFEKARKSAVPRGQSVWLNLSRCALRQKDVNLATLYIKQAKEIADLPLIGLMTELNLALIQGHIESARHILKNIQANKKNALTSVHFDEFHCLSRQVSVRETDLTRNPSASPYICLNDSRY
ncbi:hypothetical protein [Marinomonas epiphytica]